MSNAIEIRGLNKIFKIYDSHTQMALDWSGCYKARFWKKPPTFGVKHVLKNINLDIRAGERYGLIGRNGAGKTTLLKALAGLSDYTSGQIKMNGRTQLLMHIGASFHPEFTGRQNVEYSLLYQGLRGADLKKAYEDVVDFAELGDFMDQPVKNYSLGMTSRLQFAAATAIRPDILMIDEVLGAGDAYFSVKSAERMKALTHSGCTLLLVSHAKSQILEFCREGIWLEGGEIRKTGPIDQLMAEYEKDTMARINTPIKTETTTSSLVPIPASMLRPLYLECIKSFYPTVRWKKSDIPGVVEDGRTVCIDASIVSVQTFCEGALANKVDTGRDFEITILLKSAISLEKCSLTFTLFNHQAQAVGMTTSPVFDLSSGTVKKTFSMSPFNLGHRDYLCTLSLTVNGTIVQVLCGPYVGVNETNDSDPPLLHYPAKWYQNNSDMPSFSRISGIQ